MQSIYKHEKYKLEIQILFNKGQVIFLNNNLFGWNAKYSVLEGSTLFHYNLLMYIFF